MSGNLWTRIQTIKCSQEFSFYYHAKNMSNIIPNAHCPWRYSPIHTLLRIHFLSAISAASFLPRLCWVPTFLEIFNHRVKKTKSSQTNLHIWLMFLKVSVPYRLGISWNATLAFLYYSILLRTNHVHIICYISLCVHLILCISISTFWH